MTPVNAWWGSFDLAVNLFSGDEADPPSEDFIMRNSMDAKDVRSAGGRATPYPRRRSTRTPTRRRRGLRKAGSSPMPPTGTPTSGYSCSTGRT